MHAKKVAKKKSAGSTSDNTQERLSDVLSTFATLRQDGRALIERIHSSLLLAQGRSNVAIAEALGISTHTARHHTQRVLGKLKVHSRAEAGAKLRS